MELIKLNTTMDLHKKLLKLKSNYWNFLLIKKSKIKK